MKFGYGGWRAEDGEFAVRTFSTVGKRGQNQQLESVIRTLDVEFQIIREGQAAISTRFAQLEGFIRFDGRDVGFYQDNGSPSRIFIRNAESTSGVYITQYPSVTPEDGADYATHLKGTCGFAAEYAPTGFFGGSGGGGRQQLSSYDETLSFQGNGGPRVGWAESDTQRARAYVLADYTKCMATQTGRASWVVDTPTWPSPNNPLWPRHLVNEADGVQKTLRQSGGQFECTTTWNYSFEGSAPFFGTSRTR